MQQQNEFIHFDQDKKQQFYYEQLRTPLSEREFQIDNYPSKIKNLPYDAEFQIWNDENHCIPQFYNSKKISEADQSALIWKKWSENMLDNEIQIQPPQEKASKIKSAFKLFKLDHIVTIKEMHPDYGFRERLTILKDMWKQLPREEKYHYVLASRQMKDQYMKDEFSGNQFAHKR